MPNLYCDVCKDQYVLTPSGYVTCPRGCTKLMTTGNGQHRADIRRLLKDRQVVGNPDAFKGRAE